MAQDPKKILVDVIELSKQNCRIPIAGNLLYATRENFLGRIVDGYMPDAREVILATPKTAAALCDVQNALLKSNLSLFIYDLFRPLRAVKDFGHWFNSPVTDPYELERKKVHYPHLQKSDLSRLGYVAGDVSQHCFGHTVDLTIIDLENKCELDMGACFDFFGEISHIDKTPAQIGDQAYANRKLLSDAMQQQGFQPYHHEFWHFEYHEREVPEPMDLLISKELRGLNT